MFSVIFRSFQRITCFAFGSSFISFISDQTNSHKGGTFCTEDCVGVISANRCARAVRKKKVSRIFFFQNIFMMNCVVFRPPKIFLIHTIYQSLSYDQANMPLSICDISGFFHHSFNFPREKIRSYFSSSRKPHSKHGALHVCKKFFFCGGKEGVVDD